MFSVLSPIHRSSKKYVPAVSVERITPLRRLRQAAQHQADLEKAQGATAPPASEQRVVHPLSQSFSNIELFE